MRRAGWGAQSSPSHLIAEPQALASSELSAREHFKGSCANTACRLPPGRCWRPCERVCAFPWRAAPWAQTSLFPGLQQRCLHRQWREPVTLPEERCDWCRWEKTLRALALAEQLPTPVALGGTLMPWQTGAASDVLVLRAHTHAQPPQRRFLPRLSPGSAVPTRTRAALGSSISSAVGDGSGTLSLGTWLPGVPFVLSLYFF